MVFQRVRNSIADGTAAFLIVVILLSGSAKGAEAQEVTVYMNPACGCCKGWVSHLRTNGFKVTTHDVKNMKLIKDRYGVPPPLASCHTALVGGYVIEGHVPADVIKLLLQERPKVVGITVPGMPAGSPGMEGRHTEKYNVLTFDAEGKTEVYTRR